MGAIVGGGGGGSKARELLDSARGFLITSGIMRDLPACSERLLRAWARRPTGAAARDLRRFYGRHVASLSLPVRARLCVALGEAAEAEERPAVARYLYGAGVAALDPRRDEGAYAGVALRALLNAWRSGDRATLAGVSRLVGRLPGRETTRRLLLIGAFARGLERFLQGRMDSARRSFEAAMEAARESRDATGEALVHHLLARVWEGLRNAARAREHAAAARSAAARAGSWLLERRMAIEELALRLAAQPTPEALAEGRRCLQEMRRRGFRRLEGLVWRSLAMGLGGSGTPARTFLDRAEALLGGRARARGVPRGGSGPGARGRGRSDPGLAREIEALVRLARRAR